MLSDCFRALVTTLLGIVVVLQCQQPAPAAADPAGGTALPIDPAFEQSVIQLVNQQRVEAGCPPVRLNHKLRRAARTHSTAMASALTMTHYLPGEPTLGRRAAAAGYRGWTLVAENIARGFSSPESVVTAWMNSPSHRHNILNCRLRDLGVGVVLNDGQLWWTQDFGRR
ncbi:CAP domain-containing protein [Nocardioides sp. LHD-245]|uniref:CAP domain-containing protein n=1 Tax=Nocardioides sp. LHD-245 TaxID=3051387 RepID=UPI0027DF2E8B|nr:CAP domain-containing protein [Nocardioides sp. LHD-245]